MLQLTELHATFLNLYLSFSPTNEKDLKNVKASSVSSNSADKLQHKSIQFQCLHQGTKKLKTSRLKCK